ncbi:MAG TPA: TrmH family RNA methyltransferase [Pirellulaceae bacterium]|jgi:TrmH family RNA methyltransferase|nr:TrmH family RNA methyltransferase [Pirellulaceae bacterium]
MTQRIESVQNPRLKRTIRLRERKHRRAERRFLIDGLREIERADAAGVRFTEIFFDERLSSDRDVAATTAIERIVQNQPRAERLELAANAMDKLCFGDRNEGIVVAAELPETRLEEIRLPEGPAVVVVLDQVEKPGNLGAVCRSADAAGAVAVFGTGSGADFYHANAIRASLGTIFSLATAEAEAADLGDWLIQQGFRIVVARVEGASEFVRYRFAERTAIVLGSEADGVEAYWKQERFDAVRLPMLGIADSLNVSTTAAVLLYEALRQRSV